MQSEMTSPVSSPSPEASAARSEPVGAGADERTIDGTSAPASEGQRDRSIDHRRERIRIETERHRIEGYVTLARDGFRSRVSDMLNASERDFLTLTDATVAPLDGGPTESHAFLAVARRHIVFAVAADA